MVTGIVANFWFLLGFDELVKKKKTILIKEIKHPLQCRQKRNSD